MPPRTRIYTNIVHSFFFKYMFQEASHVFFLFIPQCMGGGGRLSSTRWIGSIQCRLSGSLQMRTLGRIYRRICMYIIYIYIYTHIHRGVNYNDLTATSLEIIVFNRE